MSFLDRLKREADQQRAQAEAVARERDERDARYLGHIEPRMKSLTSYLEGLTATLNEVKPPVVVPMTILLPIPIGSAHHQGNVATQARCVVSVP